VTPGEAETVGDGPSAGGPRAARPRPRARRGEGDLLRDEILDATEALLIATGDEDEVSIRAVADAVGRTPPSIYRHFEDKDTLIHSVCDRLFGHLAEEFLAARAALEDPDDPVAAARAIGRAYVTYAVEHPAVYRVLFMDRSDWSDPEFNTMEALRDSVAFRALYDVVVLGYDTSVFDGPGPDLTALAMWIGVHGTASLLIAKPDFAWPPVDDLVDLVCATQMDGVRTRA
jgi:AcrR family transcriptional regulator